jgi:hypothetical protein
LHHIDGRVRVWRHSEKRYLQGTPEEKVPFGGGFIMVWGGLTLNGRTELLIREESMTARKYIDKVLEPQLVPFVDNVGSELILQQDNVRPHLAKVVQNFLDTHNIQVMN